VLGFLECLELGNILTFISSLVKNFSLKAPEVLISTIMSFLLSAPIAYVIWIYRDANKLAELDNERAKQKLDDFHKLEEWLATSTNDENLKVVAVHQLEPYLRGDHGYPKAFQKPCCALFLTILESWGKSISDKIVQEEKNNNPKKIYPKPHLQAIHSVIFRNINVVQALKEEQVRINLSYSNFLGMHLEGANLKWTNLEGVHLEGANLKGVHLERANLKWANLGGAHLEGAHLEDAYLKEAYLEWANLEKANLEGAHLEGAYLNWAHLNGANLKWTNLKLAHLKEADFEEAHLEGALLANVHFERALGIKVEQFISAEGLDSAIFNPEFRQQLEKTFPEKFKKVDQQKSTKDKPD